MNKYTLIACTASIFLLTACSSTPSSAPESVTVTNQGATEKATQYLSEARFVIDELASQVDAPQNSDLSYFSPKDLTKAKRLLAKAKSEHQDAVNGDYSMLSVFQSEDEKAQDSKKEITQLVTEASRSFKRALLVRTTANKILLEAFSRRDYLKSINAQNHYASDYNKYSSQIDRLVTRIAAGDEARATREQPALVANLHALEIKAMLHIKLNSINKAITAHDKNSADRMLPKIFTDIVTARNTAVVTIKTTPREIGLIDEAVSNVRFQLKRLKQRLLDYNQLKRLKSSTYENYLLSLENSQLRISTALDGSDLREQAFTDQVATLVEKISQLKAQLTTLSGEVTDGSAQHQQVRNQNQALQKQVKRLTNNNRKLTLQIKTLQDAIGKATSQPTQIIPKAEVSTPVEAVPVETVPVETVPVETVPVETVPVETVPVETVPVETVPMETVPVETVPVETVTVEAAPEKAAATKSQQNLDTDATEQQGADNT